MVALPAVVILFANFYTDSIIGWLSTRFYLLPILTQMKKFIKKVALFLLLFITINIFYLIIIQKIDWNYSKRIEALNMDDPKYDVLVLGNSLAMDGIDAKYLSNNGYSSYSIAIGGSSLKTNYIQLQDYLSLYKHKPKIVILGLGSYINNLQSEGNINPIVDFTMINKNNYTTDDIPVIKFKWLFKENLKKIFSKTHRDAIIVNGQLRFSKSVPDNTNMTKENNFPIDEYMYSKGLKSIINICNANDIKLVVLEMPGFKKTRHETQHKCYVIDKEFNNGFLYDFNYGELGESFNDKEDWIGNSHLNDKGARKFTKYLLNVLEQISTNAQQCI